MSWLCHLLLSLSLSFLQLAMMLTECRMSPFAVLENALGSLLFGFQPACMKAKGKAKVSYNGGASVNENTSGGETGDSVKKRQAKKTE